MHQGLRRRAHAVVVALALGALSLVPHLATASRPEGGPGAFPGCFSQAHEQPGPQPGGPYFGTSIQPYIMDCRAEIQRP